MLDHNIKHLSCIGVGPIWAVCMKRYDLRLLTTNDCSHKCCSFAARSWRFTQMILHSRYNTRNLLYKLRSIDCHSPHVNPIKTHSTAFILRYCVALRRFEMVKNGQKWSKCNNFRYRHQILFIRTGKWSRAHDEFGSISNSKWSKSKCKNAKTRFRKRLMVKTRNGQGCSLCRRDPVESRTVLILG
jgi:hypothetical protein